MAARAIESQVNLIGSHTWRKPRAEVSLLLFYALDEGTGVERRELG